MAYLGNHGKITSCAPNLSFSGDGWWAHKGQLSQISLFLGRASLPLNIVVALLLASDNEPVLIILSRCL